MSFFVGYLIPACLMVATSYVGCDNTTLAVVLFSLALGMSALNMSSYNVNHLDIAPRYAGVLMGITNTAGTIPGMVGPYVVGYLTDNEVIYTSILFCSMFFCCCFFVSLFVCCCLFVSLFLCLFVVVFSINNSF